MSPMRAMPTTTVVKMIGVMIMRIALMKASPSGFMSAARGGSTTPSAPPITIAIRTWTYSLAYHGRFLASPAGAVPSSAVTASPSCLGAAVPLRRASSRPPRAPSGAHFHDYLDGVFDALARVFERGRHLGQREGVGVH